MLPARERSALEVVEPQLGFELLILLLDRPALMRESNQLRERRGGGQIHEEVLDARRETEVLFAQQPDFGGESTMPPFVGRRDAYRDKPRGPGPIDAVAPRHASPRPRRQAEGQCAHGDPAVFGSTRTSCDRGRPGRGSGGMCTAGVPRNT